MEEPKASEAMESWRLEEMESSSCEMLILEAEGLMLMRKVAEEELLRLSQALMVKVWEVSEMSVSGKETRPPGVLPSWKAK